MPWHQIIYQPSTDGICDEPNVAITWSHLRIFLFLFIFFFVFQINHFLNLVETGRMTKWDDQMAVTSLDFVYSYTSLAFFSLKFTFF